ncbi:hypothetical protein GHT07_08095 [Caenimonas koreensis DSM 17982]|uniref:Peptidase M10 serralysin C-terminal domain-containing protein n=1 Tax=Caenimonas koreensis DSM 17982 TaxID=1121255 RepID=A0A844B6U4_9BURK|nr:M10 family metallopeptidase [Caenimonas koreensis]MRD47237.1 hypothetical protein [Caenimonas koreensis DSM 17982]
MATQSTNFPGHGYGNVYIDSLLWGCGWTGGAVTYSFGAGAVAAGDSDIGAFTGAEWSDREKAAFTRALANYSEVCSLQFVASESQAEANIVWWLAPAAALGRNTLGMHDVPDEGRAQAYGYFGWQQASWSYLDAGGDGYVTIIHELGHGMGLAHPHDGGDEDDATRFPGVSTPWRTGTNAMNQGIWTTMSYNDGWSVAPPKSLAYGNQTTLMALDIAALQAQYGANMTTRTGDDVYVLPTANQSGTGWSCIWDAGGADTISNAGSAAACVINLNAAPLVGANAGGYVSRGAGVIGGFTIANGVVVENATGGSGNDNLTGNAADNRLDGGGGFDAMAGGGGDDTYIVDNTRDSVTEQASEGNDTVYSSVTFTLKSEIETLVLTGTGNIGGTGNNAANLLMGNQGNNSLNGSGGDDLLDGGAGADRLTGGAGADIFRFEVGDTGVGSKGRDTITDFKYAQGDRIDLRAIDANELIEGMQTFTLVAGKAFTGHAGELVFSRSVLSADTDGDGLADFELQLTGVSSFSMGLLL